MHIHEAVKEAIKTDRCITVKEFESRMKIRPTNTSRCCIGIAEGCESKDRWQPSAKDLMRDDWIVVD